MVNPITYEVWILADVDMLTNMLSAMAKYRAIHTGCWPKKLTVERRTQLSMTYGPDVKTKQEDWPMMDALYLSSQEPVKEPEPPRRFPTRFNGMRQPVKDVNKTIYRTRSDSQGILLSVSGGEV